MPIDLAVIESDDARICPYRNLCTRDRTQLIHWRHVRLDPITYVAALLRPRATELEFRPLKKEHVAVEVRLSAPGTRAQVKKFPHERMAPSGGIERWEFAARQH